MIEGINFVLLLIVMSLSATLFLILVTSIANRVWDWF